MMDTATMRPPLHPSSGPDYHPVVTLNGWSLPWRMNGDWKEGDKVRIFVTNILPEHTTVHWHGTILPNGMDEVGGLNQPHIKPGQTFVYEFEMRNSGTFMYHPHFDEIVQMAMGMMEMIVVHPRDATFVPSTATSSSS